MEELPNDLINVSLNKPATQSSLSNWSRGQSLQEDASGATADLLLDDYAFHTDLEPNPYWKVDLQQPYSISVVEILNRDTVDRFHNFRIETSIDDENYATSFIKLDENRVSNSAESPSQFTLNRPTIARFVKIVLHDTNFLHLRRVRVFGILTNSTSATQAIERLNIENKENKNDSTSDAFLIEASRLEQGDVTEVCQQISNFRLKDQAMQVAVLVLAYRYPLGLKALSHFFSSSPSFRMFVHVDQKVDIKPFVDNAAPSTVFLEDRSKVFWRVL